MYVCAHIIEIVVQLVEKTSMAESIWCLPQHIFSPSFRGKQKCFPSSPDFSKENNVSR